jgi:PAS domain S-box-containing protein
MAQDSGEPRQLDWVIRQVKDSAAFAGKVAYLHHHPNEISRDEIELVNGKFFDCSSAPVQGADEKYYGRIWTFRDITEPKQAEKKTAEQVRLMAMAERVGKLGAWALEFPGPHVVWSDEIYHIHEVPPDFQPDFESALTFYPSAARQKLREALLSKLPYDLELDFITAKGQKRFVRTTSAVEVKDDQVVRRYGLLQDLTERKRSETRFRALVDSNVQGVVFWNRNGAIAGANDAFLKLIGYTREDLESGRIDWIKLTPPEYAHLDRHSLEEISVGGVCSPYRKEYIRKDGSRVPILLGAAAFEDDPDQGVCFVIDLTERELAERAQRLSEERFSHAFEYAPNGMIILSTDGNLITANRTLCHLIGYSLAELTQKKIHDITHPDDIGEELEYISRMLSGEIHHYEIEKRYLHKDGHEVWVHLNSSLVRDLNNQPLYFIKQIQDVSQIKSANEQIEEQAALIDEASDAIFSRDLENRVVFWNKGAERLYGWSAEEVEGRCVKDLLQLDSDQFETAEKKLQQTGQWNGEIQTKTKAGATIFINSRWTLLRDSKGQPRSVLTIDTDVTERRKLEQQFLRAQRMESIGTLAGGIAHDLNNILAPILMSIDVLKSLSANAEALEILETIRVSAKRGADIVRQVLSFARGVEGKRIEVQPKHIVEDIENIVKNTFPKNVNVTTIIPRNTWTILGDPTQIHQILLNLCVNARDALPNGGNLTLKVENFVLDDQYSVMKDRAKPGPYVQISVIDSGTGIPPDLRERIFEPFFTTKEVTKGTGLGLSTVMAIVKSHGGMIDVYSEVNQGTTFKVYLPAIETSPDRERMQTAEITLPRGNGEMILVVDDESSILTITCQTLLAFGYRVLKAADGAEALAIYAENKNEVAVVLTDMMMPVLHGPALIRALKRMNPDLKIIAATGFSAEADVPSATEHGVDRFITKPYTAGTLLKTLHETLH